MNKILHLFRSSPFVSEFVNSTLEYDYHNKHTFLVIGLDYIDINRDLMYKPEVLFSINAGVEVKKPGFAEFVEGFDLVVYHGLNDFSIIEFFYRNPKILKKTVLYFWGGDIPRYDVPQKDKVKREVIINAYKRITILESDLKKLSQIYNHDFCSDKGSNRFFTYIKEKRYEVFSPFITQTKKYKKEYVIIQVGNSATETNNHIETLRKLSRFSRENIKIFLPLAYGDMQYAKMVEETARALFEDKIIVQKEYLTLEEYSKRLANVDIGIFGMMRQQALGNIYHLIGMGKKVYLCKEGQNAEYFERLCNCKVGYFEKIDEESFEEFVAWHDSAALKNIERIKDVFLEKETRQKWLELFDEC